VAAFARDAAEPGLVWVAGRLLTKEGAAGAADIAEEAIVRAAVAAAGREAARLVPEMATRWVPLGGRREASDGLMDPLRRYPEHRRAGVLVAAAILLPPGARAYRGRSDPLVAWLGKRDDPAHAALRGLMRRTTGPLWRVRAWE